MIRFLRSGALGAAAIFSLSAPAFAHATLAVTEAAPNSSYRGAIRIGHGCAGSPTRSVTVEIPDGFINAKPMPKPGWTVETRREPYRRAYDYFGTAMPEGVTAITWSGASLPDEHYDEFVFVARVTGGFEPGAVVPLPIVQLCEAGEHRWTEVAGPGQTRADLKSAAPTVRIAAGPGAAPQLAAAEGFKAGSLTIAQPWIRATPGGAKVAGGYLRITNTGREADRLLGTSIPLAARGEVHEMSNEGGVMRMREVAGGLAIEPGQSVELKPGGFHLMFLDLHSPVTVGQPIRGTLTFEKAGRVDVLFEVAPVGARGPGGGHAHH